MISTFPKLVAINITLMFTYNNRVSEAVDGGLLISRIIKGKRNRVS